MRKKWVVWGYDVDSKFICNILDGYNDIQIIRKIDAESIVPAQVMLSEHLDHECILKGVDNFRGGKNG